MLKDIWFNFYIAIFFPASDKLFLNINFSHCCTLKLGIIRHQEWRTQRVFPELLVCELLGLRVFEYWRGQLNHRSNKEVGNTSSSSSCIWNKNYAWPRRLLLLSACPATLRAIQRRVTVVRALSTWWRKTLPVLLVTYRYIVTVLGYLGPITLMLSLTLPCLHTES